MRWLTARRHRGDRGAAAILVAVLVPVLMLLVAGFIVDVGSWYSVRAQSQNGADAAALAVAESCARGDCGGYSALANTYSSYDSTHHNSNGNLGTGGAVARVVCGKSVGATNPLTSCSDPSIPSNSCPAAPASGANYVNVQTVSNNPVGLNGGVPLPGMSNLFGSSQTKVAACAQASWGAAGSCGNCVPLTISLCEWYQDTNNGNPNSFAKAPANAAYGISTSPYTAPPSYLDTITARRASSAYTDSNGVNYYTDPKTPPISDPHNPAMNSAIAGSETVLLAHSAGTSGFGGSACGTGSDASNQTAPGQFGWLCKSGSNCGGGPCTASIAGSTYGGSTGSPPPNCQTVFLDSRNTATPIYLPVYSGATGSGSNVTYTLAGFAAFVVTGWGGLGAGQGFPDYPSCDSIVTLNDTKPPDSALAWGNNLPSDTSCSGGQKGGSTNGDFANYCANYVGSNNCNGTSTQAVYGYFTHALIPQSALPGSGAQCGGSGQPKCLGASTFYLTG